MSTKNREPAREAPRDSGVLGSSVMVRQRRGRFTSPLVLILLLAACGKKSAEDAGPTSSPEVIAELRAAKKGYVDAWRMRAMKKTFER